MKNEEPILVAIHCLVYNHEPYLRDCFEGFVMQKTNFRFVAIVHDDVSTDGSSTIIREYTEKYPNIFRPIYETENQYKKGGFGLINHILDEATLKVEAKYVAICEGDDFWIDPFKLQKQVDFLEAHPDFSMCFHGAIIKNETDTEVITTCDKIETKEYYTKDIFPGWVVPTASVVYRRGMIENYPPLKKTKWMKYGDIALFLKCTHTGRVWGMEEKMSVYRMTEGGACVQQRYELNRFEHMCNHYKFLMANFPQIDKKWICDYIARYYYTSMRNPRQFMDVIVGLYNICRFKPSILKEKAQNKTLPNKQDR